MQQGEAELPYAPLLGALRPLARARHPALASLGAGTRTQLAALLPALDDGRPRGDALDPSAQLRLFEALLELLDVLSEAQPVALVLEDLHWADRSTRTFVAFLARSLRRERVLLLLSFRTDELHRRHALRPLLSELERLERARRVDLARFDRAELVEASTDILGAVPSDELVERLFTRSEGNPLYIEELLAAGLDGRGATPQSLRDAFMLRIERLSPDTQRAARAIAAGGRLDEATIAEVTGIDRPVLNLALREAVAEQVLVAGEDGRLGFRHALLREALYDDLLPGERGELHLALARALEGQEADGGEVQRAALIAGHYEAAGDQPSALRASVQAAIAARCVHAYGETADLAERALELWPRVPEPEQTAGISHVDVLVLAAGAHGFAGDRNRGETLLRAALDELDPDRDPRTYSWVLSRLARTLWSLNRGLEGVEMAQRALAMLPAGEVGRERAFLLAWLARTRVLRGRYRDAVRDGEEALAAAVAAGETEAEGETLNTLGMAHVALGHVDEGVGYLQRAIAIARGNDDADSLATAYANLADMLNLAGRTREALETAEEGLSETPRMLGRAREWMLLTTSELAVEAGDWERARALLGPPATPLIGVLLIFRRLREADLALGEGDAEVAEERLNEIRPLVEVSSEPQWIGLLGSMLGELRRRGRDLAGAREAVDRALDRIELCTDDVMRIARVSAVGLRVEADVAQRARDLHEKAEARGAIARARIHMQRLDAAAQEGGPVESAWQALGAAELTRARGRSDPARWTAAAGEWDAIGRPYPAAYARRRAAEAYVEAGDRVAGADTARAGLESARALGSRWLAEEIEALGERARLDLGAGPAADAADGNGTGSVSPAEPDPFGLTARERQVLALIAEGATNRQIGAALYMAEKTASVHVSRILRKLDVSSRTQAAAVAHRMHLA